MDSIDPSVGHLYLYLILDGRQASGRWINLNLHTSTGHHEIENAIRVRSQLYFELPTFKSPLGDFPVFDADCKLLPRLL